MDINELKDRAYESALKQGFFKKDLSYRYYTMMVITEISELIDADRRNKHSNIYLYKKQVDMCDSYISDTIVFEDMVKDSFEDELADIVLRLASLAGHLNYNLELHPTQSLTEDAIIRQSSIPEYLLHICRLVCAIEMEGATRISLAIEACYRLASNCQIALDEHIEAKLHYNSMRSRIANNNPYYE